MSPLVTTFSGASARGMGMFGTLSGNYWWGIPTLSPGISNRSTMGIYGDTIGSAFMVYQNSSSQVCWNAWDATTRSFVNYGAYTVPNTRGAAKFGSSLYFGTFDGNANTGAASYTTTSNAIQNYYRYFTVLPNGQIYVASRAVAAQTYVGPLGTSGQFSSARTFGATMVKGIGSDANNNVYIMGISTTAVWLAKYTAGTLQWQKSIAASSATGPNEGPALGVDNSGNSYLYYKVGTTSYVTMFDTNGTQTGAITTTTNYNCWGIQAIPTGGAVLAVQYGNGFHMMKLNTGMTFDQSYFVGLNPGNTAPVSGYPALVDMQITGTNIYMIGNTESSGTGQPWMANLPTAFNITGTYSTSSSTHNITLATGANTSSWTTTSLTAATSTYTDNASSPTQSTLSLSAASNTPTWSGVAIS